MKPIKIIVTGDFLPSENNFALFEKGDAEVLFSKQVCKIFADADFSIANLEGVLSDAEYPQLKDGPSIKAPKTTIAGIKNLGLKAVTLANNHITDFLQQGLNDTYSVLRDANIQYIGNVVSKGGSFVSNNYLSLCIGEKKVCIYNVSETFFNRPTKEMDGANVYDEWIVLNEIKELKREHDFLIVIYHGGAEYFPYPTPQTRTRFHRMAECGADFITAQHTHCIGCEEWYNGSYLLHGQGNFLFARQKRYPTITKTGLISEITITDNSFAVKNHIVNIKDNVLRYDEKQDLSTFNERSTHLNDEDFLIEKFTKLKVEEIMHKYLIASKGRYPLRKITKRLLPNSYKHPEFTYSLHHILRNFNVLQGERRREDMYFVWKYLLDNSMKNGK